MRISGMRRLAVVAALAGSGLMVTAGFAGPASATLKTITCTGVKGTISGNGTASGCTGNTGGSGTFPTSSLAGGSGTVTWKNGKKTSVKVTFKQVSSDENETKKCAAGTTEYSITGKVTADTTGSASIGAPVKAEACVNLSAGTYANEPGTKMVI